MLTSDRYLKEKLILKYGTEMVFVVPYSSVTHIEDRFSLSLKEEDLSSFDTIGRYILRADAETNHSFQQLIPYVLITNDKEDRFYVAKRIAGDDRLLNTYSLGFGGHIDKKDGYLNVIREGLNRELNEELTFDTIAPPKLLGTVRDLSSETKEHLGFVFLLKAKNVRVKEKDNLKGEWVSKEKLFQMYTKFEGWSRHIIDYLYEEQKKKQTV